MLPSSLPPPSPVNRFRMRRTRHVQVKCLKLQEWIQDKTIKLLKVPSAENLADCWFTKGSIILVQNFMYCRDNVIAGRQLRAEVAFATIRAGDSAKIQIPPPFGVFVRFLLLTVTQWHLSKRHTFVQSSKHTSKFVRMIYPLVSYA